MDVKWIFFICSIAVGITGMTGLRREKAVCLLLSALALPVLIFAALLANISLEDISSYFCIIAFLVLCGLRKK